jgi:hypothetical protein
MQSPANIVDKLDEAALLLTSKNYYRRKPQKVRDAEAAGLAIYVLKSNTIPQMRQCLAALAAPQGPKPRASGNAALTEASEAIAQVRDGEEAVELSPQSAYIRRLQHQMAERYSLASRSRGREPQRRVRIFRSAR